MNDWIYSKLKELEDFLPVAAETAKGRRHLTSPSNEKKIKLRELKKYFEEIISELKNDEEDLSKYHKKLAEVAVEEIDMVLRE